MEPQSYTEIAKIAQKRRKAAIPLKYLLPNESIVKLPKNLTNVVTGELNGHFATREVEILQADAEVILEKIKSRTWTALETAETFCKAAAVANQLTNCVTEVLFDEALARAKFLDDYLAKHGRVLGPFHGLPISLKDHFITPPHPTSIGIAFLANMPTNPASETLLVTMLRDMGAVMYVKTNVAMAMMVMETKNNIWGETLNPFNTDLSPGGSSGGEVALIAMKASPLGFGSDIGGSIRQPAAFTHLYALKPSVGRFPLWAISDRPFSTLILQTIGPMSRSLNSVRLWCRTLLSEDVAPWKKDPECLPMPWKENVIQPKGRKLRIGIMPPNDGSVTVHPPVERALRLTREALEKAGHEVIDWPATSYPEITTNLLDSFIDLGMGAVTHLLNMTHERPYPSMTPFLDQRTATIEDGIPPAKLKDLAFQRSHLQKNHLDRWQATASPADGKMVMDALVMPVSPWAACQRGTVDVVEYLGYAAVFNAIDLPCCTFPVTFADKAIDHKRVGFRPSSDVDRKVQDTYEPAVYHGAPVSLQLACGRLEEEKVLEVVGVVVGALDAYTDDGL